MTVYHYVTTSIYNKTEKRRMIAGEETSKFPKEQRPHVHIHAIGIALKRQQKKMY